MCAVDKLTTAGDRPFMDQYGLFNVPEVGPLNTTHFPMRPRMVVRPAGNGREILPMNWGLVPYWAKDVKIGRNAFNARMESLIEGKPMFRAAFKTRRCLLPATSYFEYRSEDGKKVPYEFAVDGGAPYAYAGLWESHGEDEELLLSCTMITTLPNELAAEFHTRMPAILAKEDYEAWLDPKAEPGELLSLLNPYPADHLSAHPNDPRRAT